MAPGGPINPVAPGGPGCPNPGLPGDPVHREWPQKRMHKHMQCSASTHTNNHNK